MKSLALGIIAPDSDIDAILRKENPNRALNEGTNYFQCYQNHINMSDRFLSNIKDLTRNFKYSTYYTSVNPFWVSYDEIVVVHTDRDSFVETGKYHAWYNYSRFKSGNQVIYLNTKSGEDCKYFFNKNNNFTSYTKGFQFFFNNLEDLRYLKETL